MAKYGVGEVRMFPDISDILLQMATNTKHVQVDLFCFIFRLSDNDMNSNILTKFEDLNPRHISCTNLSFMEFHKLNIYVSHMSSAWFLLVV